MGWVVQATPGQLHPYALQRLQGPAWVLTFLQIIPIDEETGKFKQAFNTRLDELEVVAMAMMAGRPQTTQPAGCV